MKDKTTLIVELERTISSGDIFRHFKGTLYQVVGIAQDAETKEQLVVYQSLFSDKYGSKPMWVRPLSMFMSEVDREKYRNPDQPYRFVRVKPEVKPERK